MAWTDAMDLDVCPRPTSELPVAKRRRAATGAAPMPPPWAGGDAVLVALGVGGSSEAARLTLADVMDCDCTVDETRMMEYCTELDYYGWELCSYEI